MTYKHLRHSSLPGYQILELFMKAPAILITAPLQVCYCRMLS